MTTCSTSGLQPQAVGVQHQQSCEQGHLTPTVHNTIEFSPNFCQCKGTEFPCRFQSCSGSGSQGRETWWLPSSTLVLCHGLIAALIKAGCSLKHPAHMLGLSLEQPTPLCMARLCPAHMAQLGTAHMAQLSTAHIAQLSTAHMAQHTWHGSAQHTWHSSAQHTWHSSAQHTWLGTALLPAAAPAQLCSTTAQLHHCSGGLCHLVCPCRCTQQPWLCREALLAAQLVIALGVMVCAVPGVLRCAELCHVALCNT